MAKEVALLMILGLFHFELFRLPAKTEFVLYNFATNIESARASVLLRLELYILEMHAEQWVGTCTLIMHARHLKKHT